MPPDPPKPGLPPELDAPASPPDPGLPPALPDDEVPPLQASGTHPASHRPSRAARRRVATVIAIFSYCREKHLFAEKVGPDGAAWIHGLD